MSPEDFELVAELCAARSGLAVDSRKTYLIESRLGPIARREGFGSISELLAAMKVRGEDSLVWSVVEAMSAGETAFFRDRRAFETFGSVILPKLARIRGEEPIRVWSAACGPGQEVYSLAMTLDEQRGALPPKTRIELFGSDISERALEKAQSGLYTQFEIQRGLSVQRLVRYFDKVDDNWQLAPRIRQMVRWRRINLVSDLSAAGRFDVIFCRHLLESMTQAARPLLLRNLARALSPEGYLVVSQDEATAGLGDGFLRLQDQREIYCRDPAYELAA